jgi:DNA-binding GntR family transcriptional regulator
MQSQEMTVDSLNKPMVGSPLSKLEYVLQMIRSEIDSGVVKPGDPLRQMELSRRLKVSPTPIREALRLLEAEGRVVYSPNKGVVVANIDEHWIDDLYEIRELVEGMAVRRAVERMSSADLQRIHELFKQLETEESPARLSELNRDFHFEIYRSASENLAQHIAALWRPLPRQVTTYRSKEDAQVLHDQHVQIMDALLAEDAERAGTLMEVHIRTSRSMRNV